MSAPLKICSPLATEGSGRHPEPGNNQQQSTNRESVSDLCLDSFPPSVPEKQGTCLPAHGEQSPSKKEAFHAGLSALRKDPARCCRCAKLSSIRFCADCRTAQARRRDLKAARPVVMKPAEVAAILRRVASLEDAVARLQLAAHSAHRRGYGAGYRTGARHERKVRFAESPEISTQELATINHAYDRRAA